MMSKRSEDITSKVLMDGELRKKLSEYFDEITGLPVCDAIERSIRSFTASDTVYQDLEMEEDKWEKKWGMVLKTLDEKQAEVIKSYLDALQMTAFKRTDLAYISGVKDAIF